MFSRLFQYEVEIAKKFPDFQSSFFLLEDFSLTMQEHADFNTLLMNWAI